MHAYLNIIRVSRTVGVSITSILRRVAYVSSIYCYASGLFLGRTIDLIVGHKLGPTIFGQYLCYCGR